MHSFTDGKNTQWLIDLNSSTLRRVQALLGINLTEPLSTADGETKNLAERIAGDTLLRVDVLWAICSVQASGLAIDQEEFATRLSGGVIRLATAAFWDDLRDFFQDLGQPEVAEVISQVQEVQKTISAAVCGQMPKLNAAMHGQITKAIESEGEKMLAELTKATGKQSGKSSTASPG